MRMLIPAPSLVSPLFWMLRHCGFTSETSWWAAVYVQRWLACRRGSRLAQGQVAAPRVRAMMTIRRRIMVVP